MDQYHVETARISGTGYDMLEKPVANNKRDLLKVAEKARENGCKLVVCHVLRYTPFYKKAKELIEGAVGEVVHIDAGISWCLAHRFSFIRGQWRNKDEWARLSCWQNPAMT